MACNGRNHRTTCDCNFRGGRKVGAAQLQPARSQRRRQTRYLCGEWNSPRLRKRHFNTPNAKCPKCGAAVFFYKNPQGGSVYFNKLGYPWSRHPCTDERARWRGRRYYDGPDPRTGDLFLDAVRFDGLEWVPLVGGRQILIGGPDEGVFAYLAINLETGARVCFVTSYKLFFDAPLMCRPLLGGGRHLTVSSPELNRGAPINCFTALDGRKKSIQEAAKAFRLGGAA
jgi:hypothetical protein